MPICLESLPASDPAGGTPKHEQLKDQLLAKLSAGEILPGQNLPSEVEMAAMLGVARNTVRQALASLEQRGVVHRIRGRGTFICDDAQHKLTLDSESVSVLGLGLVLPQARLAFYPSLQHGFGKAAQRIHNEMLVCETNNDLHQQADVLLRLLSKKVAGIAIVPTDTTKPTPAHHIRPLQENGIPVVFCHRGVDGISAPLVTFSYPEVGRVAGHALGKNGHRCVAYIAPGERATYRSYLSSLRETLGEYGGEVPEDLVFHKAALAGYIGDEGERVILEVLEQMFSGTNRPTAIMTSFDPVAELVYVSLNRMGIRVPEDVSLVGFGGAFRNGAIIRKLTSVVVDEIELGVRAVEIIEDIHRGLRALDDDSRVTMPLSLTAGETLGQRS